MRNSNLAERLEEFAAAVDSVDAPKEKATHVVAVAGPGLNPRVPRRLSFNFRRIQIRDTGLRLFRVS